MARKSQSIEESFTFENAVIQKFLSFYTSEGVKIDHVQKELEKRLEAIKELRMQ